MNLLFYILIIFIFLDPENHCQTANDIYKKCIKAVVLIKDESGNIGAGFFINPRNIVTNYHVTSELDLQTAKIRSINNRSYYIRKIAAEYKTVDLAIIETINESQHILTSFEGEVTENNIVYSIGHHTDGKKNANFFRISQGWIRKIETDSWNYDDEPFFLHRALLIQHTAMIKPGCSGGPLLNSKGEVIGINTFFYDDSLNLAVHVRELIYILNNNYISYNEKTDTEKKSLHRRENKKISFRIKEALIKQYEFVHENFKLLMLIIFTYYLFLIIVLIITCVVACFVHKRS